MLNKILRLERPLAFLDLETTGLQVKIDRIIQIAITIHYPHRDPIAWKQLINPGILITNQGSHHITDDMVADQPRFRDIAPALALKLVNIDIAGHNVIKFDIELLKNEMIREGVSWPWDGDALDTVLLYRKYHPHTLSNYYREYAGKELEGAHDAGVDVEAVEIALAGQLNRHQDIPRTIKELVEHCSTRYPNAIDKTGKFIWIDQEPCINFGKHKGKPIRSVDKGYLIWMINQDNFPDDAILIAGDALKGLYPVK